MQLNKALCAFFLLCSCTPKGPWTLSSLPTGYNQFDAKKLLYKGSDCELEFIRTQNAFICSFNVLSGTIPQDCPLTINQEEVEVFHLAGGQKLLLSYGAIDRIVEMLRQGCHVEIDIAGYNLRLSPFLFNKNFKKLSYVRN